MSILLAGLGSEIVIVTALAAPCFAPASVISPENGEFLLLIDISLWKNLFIYLFYFWPHWPFVAASRLSLIAGSRGYSLIAVHRLLTAVASHCRVWTLGYAGFSSCGTWALECGLSSWGPTGLVAPRHVGSSWTSD